MPTQHLEILQATQSGLSGPNQRMSTDNHSGSYLKLWTYGFQVRSQASTRAPVKRGSVQPPIHRKDNDWTTLLSLFLGSSSQPHPVPCRTSTLRSPMLIMWLLQYMCKGPSHMAPASGLAPALGQAKLTGMQFELAVTRTNGASFSLLCSSPHGDSMFMLIGRTSMSSLPNSLQPSSLWRGPAPGSPTLMTIPGPWEINDRPWGANLHFEDIFPRDWNWQLPSWHGSDKSLSIRLSSEAQYGFFDVRLPSIRTSNSFPNYNENSAWLFNHNGSCIWNLLRQKQSLPQGTSSTTSFAKLDFVPTTQTWISPTSDASWCAWQTHRRSQDAPGDLAYLLCWHRMRPSGTTGRAPATLYLHRAWSPSSPSRTFASWTSCPLALRTISSKMQATQSGRAW